MIRGYRWKFRDGQHYYMRVADGYEVATVYHTGGHQAAWHVRGSQSACNEVGFCDSVCAAKYAAEQKVREKGAAGTLIRPARATERGEG